MNLLLLSPLLLVHQHELPSQLPFPSQFFLPDAIAAVFNKSLQQHEHADQPI